MDVFDPAKVAITRKRFSVTQGEVLVEYDGKRIEQYGDAIKMDETGKFDGHDDAFWMDVAEREAVERGMALTRTPVFTGRYGEGAREVEEGGKDHLLVEVLDERDLVMVHVYGPDAFVRGEEDAFVEEKHGDKWVTYVTMRAWNAEDAFRNLGGALSQQRAHTDGEATWESIPFLDEDGEPSPEGGEGEYGAYAPDETAREGMTRPDVFTNVCVVHADVGVLLTQEATPAP